MTRYRIIPTLFAVLLGNLALAHPVAAEQEEIDWALSTFSDCVEATRNGKVYEFTDRGYEVRDNTDKRCSEPTENLPKSPCQPEPVFDLRFTRKMPSGALRRVYTSGPDRPRFYCAVTTEISDIKLVKNQLRAFSKSPPAGLRDCWFSRSMVKCGMTVTIQSEEYLGGETVHKLRVNLRRDSGGHVSFQIQ